MLLKEQSNYLNYDMTLFFINYLPHHLFCIEMYDVTIDITPTMDSLTTSCRRGARGLAEEAVGAEGMICVAVERRRGGRATTGEEGEVEEMTGGAAVELGSGERLAGF